MTVFEGKLVSENIKVGIVASRFNEFITSKLIGGAMDGLLRHNVREQDVDIAWVPGAFEAPLAAQKMAQSGRYNAVICLGAVIRGAHEPLRPGLQRGRQGHRPRIAGKRGARYVRHRDHRHDRAGNRACRATKAGNKGFDCATSAIEMVNLLREIEG